MFLVVTIFESATNARGADDDRDRLTAGGPTNGRPASPSTEPLVPQGADMAVYSAIKGAAYPNLQHFSATSEFGRLKSR